MQNAHFWPRFIFIGHYRATAVAYFRRAPRRSKLECRLDVEADDYRRVCRRHRRSALKR